MVEANQVGKAGGAQRFPRGEFGFTTIACELVPGTDGKTIVAAVDPIAHGGAQFARDRPLMFDREIRNAPSRIEAIWRRKRRRRANVEAGATTAAVVGLGRIMGQVQGSENGAQKKPRPVSAGDKVRVFALPSKTTLSGEGLFHNRGGIDKYFYLAACVGDQPARQFFQACLDDIVIVISLGIDRDRAV